MLSRLWVVLPFFHLMPEKSLLKYINTEIVHCLDVVKQFPHNFIVDLQSMNIPLNICVELELLIEKKLNFYCLVKLPMQAALFV